MSEYTEFCKVRKNGGSQVFFEKNETWRVFRIMAEFVDSFETMSQFDRLVSVFGSARIKPEDPVYQDCVRLGELLAEHNYGVLTGGGPGIMEAANRGASHVKDAVSIGLNIKLPHEQNPNAYQGDSLFFRYFFIRKVCFLKYSVALIVYPGGFGTLDELSEVLTMIQTNKVTPIPVVFVGRDFFQPLLDWFQNSLLKNKLIGEEDLSLYHVADNAQEAFEIMAEHHIRYGFQTTAVYH